MEISDIDLQATNKILMTILSGKRPEGYELDWTSGIKNLDSIGEKIAAFATSGGGWLIIGLSDDRPPNTIGIDDRQVVITKVGEVLRNCDPIPTVDEPIFIEHEGKTLAFYRITGLGGTICSYKDTPYHRVQDSSRKMSTNQLKEVWARLGVLSWEQRPSRAGIDEIDRSELNFYLSKVKERGEAEQQTEENFLKTNKAITEDGKLLTNLGLISLGQDPSRYLPQCKIQLIRFRGDKPIERIAAILLSQPARKLIESCENFLRLNLPVKERYEGTLRIEEPIIPLIVLREAIVNMIVHRDYSDPQESLIRIFDDRVEFQNPGAPTQAELKKIIDQGIPLHRNQWIYNFLRPVHKAEGAGQGFPIMKREMQQRGLADLEITTLGNLFHLMLRFKQREPETLADVVLLYGKEKKVVTTSDIMRVYKVSRPKAIRLLDELVTKGFAEHKGYRKDSKYIFKS